ncbi:unnamed protein product [Brachionus calyciflorus]|uniref:Deoxynucleoside kinase domain-containing protein n=1 Tax=Brachionus calyciflorus TaxID=104777 RepID=A0A814KB79_9BILA|nr:unnamed protein product [Brachionus calyciflorus]
MNNFYLLSQLAKGKNLRISIEGNIASGKSSLIEYLRKKLDVSLMQSDNDDKKLSNTNFNVITEPVHLWRNLNGNNLLDLMYKDPTKWSFSFHSYVQMTMLENHLKIQNNLKSDVNNTINIMERSLYSARYCFVENIYNSNFLKPVEYEILDKWFNWMKENHDCELDLIFYLRTDPETCFNRVLKRNRSEEVERISLSYLKNLHDLHEKWLVKSSDELDSVKYYKPKKIIVINANQHADEVYKCVENEARKAIFMKN